MVVAPGGIPVTLPYAGKPFVFMNGDMAQFLPLFPLSLIVFPGEELRLHIFEPRYRQLIQDCIDSDLTFGIPAVMENDLGNIATEVQLVSVDKRYAEGRMDITTRGMRRARMLEYFQQTPGKLYPGGQVQWLESDEQPDPALQRDVFQLIESLHDALGVTKKFADDPEGIRAFLIGHHIGLNLKQEYALLTLDSEIDRLRFVVEHLQNILPVVMETERLKAKAKLNGHYKNMIPPDF